MNKYEALNEFWNSFGVPAYEMYSVPTGKDKPAFPYIVFTADVDNISEPVSLFANVYTRSNTWLGCNAIAERIAERVGLGGCCVPIEGGGMWIKRGNGFMSNLGDDEDDLIKRKYIHIEVEFITAT